MCGGKGTRMWPISSTAHPKQFESILGKKSMFRETIERVLAGFDPEDIYIATSDSFREYLKDQAGEVPANNFIFEPAMRDNLGALGIATAMINKRHPDAVMVVLWGADHVVKDVPAFLRAIKFAALQAHENEVIVHVDTIPSYPTVHNGWVEVGDTIKTSGDLVVREFVHFVEKPSVVKAQEFYTSKKYLIHTGYMATRPSLLLKYYQEYAPQSYSIIKSIQGSIDTPDWEATLATEYPKFEKTSVDYGLFEKLPPRTQWEVPAVFGWIDVGTWELLYHGLDKDENGNVVIGKANLIDTKNSLIVSKNSGVGLIGLDNMIIVETDGGLLVCPMSSAPQVKDLYNEMYENS